MGAGGEFQADLARRMAGKRYNRRAIGDRVAAFDGRDEAALNDRQHAVLVAAVIGLRPLCGLTGAQLDLGLAHEIARIGKRRHPAAGDQARVPADVVGVEMGAEHDIDILGRAAGRSKMGDVMATGALVPVWPRRSRLMFADTGIDQDRLAAKADQMALDRKVHQRIRGVDMDAVERHAGRAQRLN